MELLPSATFSFAKGKIIPQTFSWYGRDYQVRKINLVFTRQDAGRKYLCFAIETDGACMELRLDRQDLRVFIVHE